MRTVLLQLDLGDLEHLTVFADHGHLYLHTELDGCESTSMLSRGEAIVLRDTVSSWIGAR